eukprot:PhF_6_TR6896/c0_g1_i1/m.9992
MKRPLSNHMTRWALNSAKALKEQFVAYQKTLPNLTAFTPSVRAQSGLLMGDDDDDFIPNNTNHSFVSQRTDDAGRPLSSQGSCRPMSVLSSRLQSEHRQDRESWERIRSRVLRSSYGTPPVNPQNEYKQYRREVLGDIMVHAPPEETSATVVVVDNRPASRGLSLVEKELAPEVPQDYLAPGPFPTTPFSLSHSPHHPDPSLVRTPAELHETLRKVCPDRTSTSNPMGFVRKMQD